MGGLMFTGRDLAAMNEHTLLESYRHAAERRLRMAKGLMRKAQGHGSMVRRFAEREMACAKAEAEEWGVAT